MSSETNKKISDHADLELLAKNIRDLMHKINIDSAGLSKMTGIAVTTINSLRRGAGNPTLSTLSHLADFFDVSIGQLTESILNTDGKNTQTIHDIPLLMMDELEDFLRAKNAHRHTVATVIDTWDPDKCFAVTLNNNSMSPFFEKGTIFVIACDAKVHDGDIALVQFDGHSMCFRKVFIEGKSYFFKPVSEVIGKNITQDNKFRIIGLVIKAIQNFYNN